MLLFSWYFRNISVQIFNILIGITIFQPGIQWFLYWHSIRIAGSTIRWTLSWMQTVFSPQGKRKLSLIKLQVSEKVIFLLCFRINVKGKKKNKNMFYSLHQESLFLSLHLHNKLTLKKYDNNALLFFLSYLKSTLIVHQCNNVQIVKPALTKNLMLSLS